MVSPSRVAKSTATPSLPPFIVSKNAVGPRRLPSGRAVDSTLITRAPACCSRRPHRGPAQSDDRSTTVTSAIGLGAAAPGSRVACTGQASVAGATSDGRTATGSPSIHARAAVAAPGRARRWSTTVGHGSPTTGASSWNQAATRSVSSDRASVTASHPSADRTSRVAPPQLRSPARDRPWAPARSPSSARPSTSTGRPSAREAAAIRAVTARRRPTSGAGGPSPGPSARPVRAMAPLAAQTSTS